uniref:Uncharacterized protein n=1 Tax=Solanum tuberosum TaxID=4113 RepID=M1BKP0_SOLTU
MKYVPYKVCWFSSTLSNLGVSLLHKVLELTTRARRLCGHTEKDSNIPRICQLS